jgi:transcriptional regulator with XRE-family HTH domain
MSIVLKIEKLREAQNLTKTELADKLKVNRDTVYNWTDDNIKVSTLQKISDILRVDILYFLSDKKESVKKYSVEEPEVPYSNKTLFRLDRTEIIKIDVEGRTLEIIKKK